MIFAPMCKRPKVNFKFACKEEGGNRRGGGPTTTREGYQLDCSHIPVGWAAPGLTLKGTMPPSRHYPGDEDRGKGMGGERNESRGRPTQAAQRKEEWREQGFP